METRTNNTEDIPLLRLIPLTLRMLNIGEKKKEFGITKTQAILLAALLYRGGLTMSQIAESISSSHEQATRAVAPLVEKGYVKRVGSPADRKKVFVELTPAGHRLMDSFRKKVIDDFDQRMDRSLSEEEKRSLLESVENIIEILSKIE